jgi:hypothetical protein
MTADRMTVTGGPQQLLHTILKNQTKNFADVWTTILKLYSFSFCGLLAFVWSDFHQGPTSQNLVKFERLGTTNALDHIHNKQYGENL